MRLRWFRGGRFFVGGIVASALSGAVVGVGGYLVEAEQARVAALASVTGTLAGGAWSLIPLGLALRRRYGALRPGLGPVSD